MFSLKDFEGEVAKVNSGVSIPQAVISWLQQYHAGSRVALEMM